MGLLHDALELGYITMDEYNSEEFDDWRGVDGFGRDASVYGDTSAFQAMAMDLESRGIQNLADEAWGQVTDSMYAYAAENEFNIFYNYKTSRWQWEAGTERAGQFTFDPYHQIRFGDNY